MIEPYFELAHHTPCPAIDRLAEQVLMPISDATPHAVHAVRATYAWSTDDGALVVKTTDGLERDLDGRLWQSGVHTSDPSYRYVADALEARAASLLPSPAIMAQGQIMSAWHFRAFTIYFDDTIDDDAEAPSIFEPAPVCILARPAATPKDAQQRATDIAKALLAIQDDAWILGAPMTRLPSAAMCYDPSFQPDV